MARRLFSQNSSTRASRKQGIVTTKYEGSTVLHRNSLLHHWVRRMSRNLGSRNQRSSMTSTGPTAASSRMRTRSRMFTQERGSLAADEWDRCEGGASSCACRAAFSSRRTSFSALHLSHVSLQCFLPPALEEECRCRAAEEGQHSQVTQCVMSGRCVACSLVQIPIAPPRGTAAGAFQR